MNKRFGSAPSECIKHASLTLSCPDQVGVLARITGFFADRVISLTCCSEYIDDGTLFLRLQWPLNDYWEDHNSFCKDFADTATAFMAEYSVKFCDRRHSIGLFVANETEVLLGILNQVEANTLGDLDVAFIMGTDQTASKIADRYGLPFFCVEHHDGILNHDRRMLDVIQRYKCDFLGLAQFPYKLPHELVQKCACPIIKTTPMPQFSMVGPELYLMAYTKGAKLLGAVSFLYDSSTGVDGSVVVNESSITGPIVHQLTSPIKNGSSVDDLQRLGAALERKVFSSTLTALLEHRVLQIDSKAVVFD